MSLYRTAGALLLLLVSRCSAQTTTTTSASTACTSVLVPSYSAPVVSSGYTAQLIVNGLQSPRSLLFDQSGALLVVQQGVGIVHITFTDHGGTCLVVDKKTNLIENSDLNHGIELSSDGKTLYASSAQAVYSWTYDAGAVTVSSENTTLIQNMSGTDHTTRTLLLSRKQPGMLLVSRGSAENIDEIATQQSSGHSQIRAFDIANMPSGGQPYDFASEGKLLGWGLRNSVGVAEEPITGGIYSVENSADQLVRDGTDIHQDDPGEEMNFHGFLNGSTEDQGGNYGYPNCFALWGTNIPNKGNLTVGSQFVLDPNSTLNDATCASEYVPPRLTFQAHMAPLDIKFVPNGTEAYVTFHGSWDRTVPVGYKLTVISFADGQPVEPPNSTTAAVDVLANANLTACPNGCFRPVGLALDSQGRIFMASDATGEIYVVQKVGASAAGNGTGSASPSPNAAAGVGFLGLGAVSGYQTLLLVGLTTVVCLLGGAFIITT